MLLPDREKVIEQIHCPIATVLDVISAKWTVEILREVSITPTRTRKFLRAIPGLSMKSLQNRLKELEKYGFIERKDFDELPKRVEHSITERGRRVLCILTDIKRLSDEIFTFDCLCPVEHIDHAGECRDFQCPNRPQNRWTQAE